MKLLISESNLNKLEGAFMKPDRYTFMNACREFMKSMLSDPSSNEIPDLFSKIGMTKGELLKHLTKPYILCVDKQQVNDDGTANIKFSVGDNVKQKLRKLYIKMFEKNAPIENINEEGCCGACGEGCNCVDGGNTAANSGSYEAPLQLGKKKKDEIIRKPLPGDALSEAMAAGAVADGGGSFMSNASYDAPAFLDDETADHRNLVKRSRSDYQTKSE